jgi:hypothetical protein
MNVLHRTSVFLQALSALAAGLKHNTLLEAWDLEHKVCAASMTGRSIT